MLMVLTDKVSLDHTDALLDAATHVSALLRTLGNERRLLILCLLIEHGPMSVNVLADRLGLGQSALSQHLAKMRDEHLLVSHREAQNVFYRVADPKLYSLITSLKQIFCT